MIVQLGWRLMFRVNDLKAAQGSLARTAKLLDRPFTKGACERYWKIPELWSCSANTPLNGVTGAEQLLDSLVQAHCLAIGWRVHGLDLGPAQELLGFDGIFARGHGNRPHLSELDWAHFSVVPVAGV